MSRPGHGIRSSECRPQSLLLNTRIMNHMSKPAGNPERAVNGFMSVARLLEVPRLARLYSFVLQAGPVTIDDIADRLASPRTTIYSDAGTLVELGVLARNEAQKSHTYTAAPISLTADLDGDEYTITPTLIEAFGRSPQDRDLDLLIERHGIGKLAAAMPYAVPYEAGEMSEQIAARELDLQPAFAIATLQALGTVVSDMKSVDPYLDQMRSATDH